MASDEEIIGRVIDRNWRIVRKIGEGGMGTVWEVVHKDVRKLRRAVKQIRSNLSENQEAVRRFRREVNLMAALEGADHIVRVHGFDAEEGFGTFVVMDLIDGPSLAQIIKQKGALPYEQVLKFGQQIASALQLVHEIEVVHRDIKAPNVLVDLKRQKAFLTDFGIAKELAAAEGEQTVDGTQTTGQIQFIGTPRYSSPEQLRVEYPPRPIWDIYSMGALLYESYSGLQYLPQFRSYPEFLRHIGMDPAFQLQLAYPTPPPPSFADLIEHCLRLEADKRLASAAELAARLEECEQERRRRVVITPVPPPPPSEPTFEEEETRKEDFRAPRHDLRDEIERRFGQLEEIEETLAGLGFNLPAGPAAETLGLQLREISIIEGEGQYQQAVGRLETLREQAAAAQQRAEQAAHDGVERRVAELDAERHVLERDAGAWIDGTQLAALEQALAEVRRAVGEGRWKVAGDDLGAIPAQLRAAAAAAGEAAQAAAEQALGEAGERMAALQQLDADAVPDGFDLAALRGQVGEHLQAGQLDAAAQQADAARATLAAVLERTRELAAQRLRAARAALEQRLAGLDVDAARAVAAEEMDRVAASRRAGAEAEAAGDLRAALAAAAEAERAAVAALERLRAAQEGERRNAAAALRALLAETAEAPAELVGDARTAAQAVLDQPGADHAVALAGLREAAARLSGAHAELPAFAEALRGRDAAEAARAAAAELTLSRAERRRVDAGVTEAARAFAARRWNDATARYAEAQALWESLAATAHARTVQEQCAAQRAALLEELDGLAPLEAERAALQVPADASASVEALRGALAPIAEQESAGALDAALAGLTTLRARAAEVRRAHDAALRGALEQLLAAVTAQRASLLERAGALLAADDGAALERSIARAAAAAAEGRWGAARSAVAAAQDAVARVETGLRRDSEAAVAAQLAAADGDRQALTASGAAPEIDLASLQAHTAALLEQGQFAAARQAADAAAAELAQARAAREREFAERARAARAGLEASLGGLDVDAARAVARRAVERGERLRGEAAAAEQARDYAAAIDAYQAAAAAYADAAAQLDEQQRRELAELATAVRGRLQELAAAPALLAEPARQAARDALEKVDGPDRAAAGAALRSAGAALEQALADVPVFAAAEARRTAAAEVQARLAPLEVTDEERAAAQRGLVAGAAAFERRDWAQARDHFAAAERAFVELVALGEDRLRAGQELAAERAAARGELADVAERAGSAPVEVVGAALHAAQALLAEDEPTPQALRDGGAALVSALADVPAYEAAAAARARAQGLQEQVAARKLKRSRLKPARAQRRAADEAMTAEQWTTAGQRYGEASDAFAALLQLPDDTTSVWPYAVGAVLVVVAVAAAYVLTRPPGPSSVTIKPAEKQVVAEKPPVAEIPPVAVKPPAAEPAPVAQKPQVAEKPLVEEKPPAPAAPHIASARPASDLVAVDEGKVQSFSVQLDPQDANVPVQWSLAGKQVAAGPGLKAWDYKPDFKAAGGSPYEVTAKVGDGTGADQTHRWTVDVADQNQVPEVLKAQPAQGQEVKKTIGQSASFAVDAKDPDGDPLRYQWTVDGKPAGGNKPTLDVPVERANETVALAISDGKQDQPLHLEWEISGGEAPFAMTAQPPSLRQLAFGGSQSFKVAPASGTAAAGIQIAWAVNGEKVADGPTYLYKASDPDSVGRAPVQVRATASDAGGKQFTKEWSFIVEPPPLPKITGASPSGSTINAPPGAPLKLTVNAAQPVSGQRFTYVFDVDGKQTRSDSPSISVTPTKQTVVVASIEDNFKQVSGERRWMIAPPIVASAPPPVVPVRPSAADDPVTLVTGWIDSYRTALNHKDVAKQCALLQLDAGKCSQLGNAMATQNDLKVAFDDVKVQPLADGRASARYTRVDEFVDPSGKTQTRSTSVAQTFRIVNGAAQIDRSGQ